MRDWAAWHRELVSNSRSDLCAMAQRLGLALVSLPYAGVTILRNRLYDLGIKKSHAAAAPVVSVGNLTLGGTGKTPAVEYLAAFYRARNIRVAILSRGYGGDGARNDEALVLEENLPDVPHLQGRDRAALSQTAVQELESQLLLLDDGFQHRRLRRDLDLVLIDATNPWGYGRVFPRGLLREPVSGLRRAHAVLVTRCDQAAPETLRQIRSEVRHHIQNRPILETRHAPRVLINANGSQASLENLNGRPVGVFSGLGNPGAFIETLKSLGARLVAQRTYSDHHRYSREDVDDLANWATTLPEGAWAVTSQKDLVKLRMAHLGRMPLWALKIALEPLTDPSGLHALLGSLV